MSLLLFRKREDGGIESGWFEPEESRKKRDNGWVTNPTGEKPKEIEYVGEVSKDAEKVTVGVVEDKPSVVSGKESLRVEVTETPSESIIKRVVKKPAKKGKLSEKTIKKAVTKVSEKAKI